MCFRQGVGLTWSQLGKFERILDQIQGSGVVKYIAWRLVGQLQIIFLNSNGVEWWIGVAGVGDEIINVEKDG